MFTNRPERRTAISSESERVRIGDSEQGEGNPKKRATDEATTAGIEKRRNAGEKSPRWVEDSGSIGDVEATIEWLAKGQRQIKIIKPHVKLRACVCGITRLNTVS